MRTSILCSPALLAGLAAAASAQVPSVYVDLTDLNLGLSGSPSATYGAAVGTPGVWNEVDISLIFGSTFDSGPLMDTAGSPTAIVLSIDGGANDILPLDEDNALTSGDDAALLDDCAFVEGPATFTFTNLPAGNYDVYTYAIAPDNATYETSVNVTGSSSGSQIVGGDFAAGFAVGTTHALHTVTVGATGMLVISTDIATEFDSINGFQLIPAGGGGPQTIGTPFCSANPNSTGAPGEISAFGSTIAANNDVTLGVSSVPPGQFGIFVVSRIFGSATPIGAGNLCLNGQIGRYQSLAQIWQADPSGEASLTIDLNAIPTPMSLESAMPGDTWNWQAWHRDLGGAGPTSNFTNGVSVTFI